MTVRADPSRGTAAPWFRRSAPVAFRPPEVRRASDPDTAGVRARGDVHRPELQAISAADERRVRSVVRSRGLRCAGCGRRRFTVGDALYLGFLFAADGKDDYLVALTCRHRGCPAPRTGVHVTGGELFG